MKNVRISVVLSIAILFLFAGEASALFDNKFKEASKKLEEAEAVRAELVKETSGLEAKCASLERDNAALKEDRSNFLVRIKQLMDERNQGKPAAEAAREIESLKRELLELQKTIGGSKGSTALAAGSDKQPEKPDEEKEALRKENLILKKDAASLKNGMPLNKRSKKLKEELEFLKSENISLKKEASSLKSGMPPDKRSEKLEEELESLKGENLALQKEMASLREKGPDLPDADAVEEKAKELRKELLSRQKESAKLHSELARLEKENDSLGASKKEADFLKKEKKKMSDGLKGEKKLSSQAVKEKDAVIKEKDALAAELKQYKKNYAEAVKRNKAFERDIKNMPKKFSELARQNIAMRKETSEMHYNLGVFYAKNKEYERAVNEFKKTVDIDPEHAYAYFNLGYINAEYMANRKEAITNFRHYLNLAKSDDKDAEWAKKYILTWQTWEGKQSID